MAKRGLRKAIKCIPAQSNKILGYFEKEDENAKIACCITDEIIRLIEFGDSKTVALDILKAIIANIPVENETESRRKHSGAKNLSVYSHNNHHNKK